MKQFRLVWFIGERKFEGEWFNTSDVIISEFHYELMEGYSNWYIEYREVVEC